MNERAQVCGPTPILPIALIAVVGILAISWVEANEAWVIPLLKDLLAPLVIILLAALIISIPSRLSADEEDDPE